jgi:hypothetical protein
MRHAPRLRDILLLICCVFVAAAPAHAKDKDSHEDRSKKIIEPLDAVAWTIKDNTHHSRPQELALTISLWPDVLGVSGWYAYPIAPDGFIRDLNDSFALEVGATMAWWRSDYFGGAAYSVFMPAFGGRWNFHLTRDWTTFAALKIALLFGISGYQPDYATAGFTLGALYRIQENMHLRLELGYPLGLNFGLSFPFGG